MRVKEEKTTKSEARAYVESSSIGRLFKKDGVYDDKMFTSGNRVTYTFIDEKEVVSLHFDSNRRSIFYNGRNISNMELTDQQKAHLKKFKENIQNNKETKNFVEDYSHVLKEFVS